MWRSHLRTNLSTVQWTELLLAGSCDQDDETERHVEKSPAWSCIRPRFSPQPYRKRIRGSQHHTCCRVCSWECWLLLCWELRCWCRGASHLLLGQASQHSLGPACELQCSLPPAACHLSTALTTSLSHSSLLLYFHLTLILLSLFY